MQAACETTDRKLPWPLRLTGAALLALAGAAGGYAVANFMEGGALPWDDGLALLMSLMLVATAIAMVAVLVSRPSRVPRGCGVLQIVVMALAGVILALPVLAPAGAPAEVVFGGVAALLAVQTVANLMLWRAADEMFRRVILETAALTFVVGQMALFLYAAAERLGLVAPVTSWGLIGVMMGLYLAASILTSARRGLK